MKELTYADLNRPTNRKPPSAGALSLLIFRLFICFSGFLVLGVAVQAFVYSEVSTEASND